MKQAESAKVLGNLLEVALSTLPAELGMELEKKLVVLVMELQTKQAESAKALQNLQIALMETPPNKEYSPDSQSQYQKQVEVLETALVELAEGLENLPAGALKELRVVLEMELEKIPAAWATELQKKLVVLEVVLRKLLIEPKEMPRDMESSPDSRLQDHSQVELVEE